MTTNDETARPVTGLGRPLADSDPWVRCVVEDHGDTLWFAGTETDHYMGVAAPEGHVLRRLEDGDEVLVRCDADEYPRVIALWVVGSEPRRESTTEEETP